LQSLSTALCQCFSIPSILSIPFAPEPLPTGCNHIKALKELDLYDMFYPDTPVTNDDASKPILSFDKLLVIHALFVDDNIITFDLPSITALDFAISVISLHNLTPAKKLLGAFTWCKLQKLDTWPLWQAGKCKQLYQFWDICRCAIPYSILPGTIVLHPHWNYKLKSNGTCCSCKCCDNSLCTAPHLHTLLETYASCIEMPIFQLQCALAATQNQLRYAGNAYMHSHGPSTACYL
jgi:hypothetical protein